jgi:hypothetical protein
MGCKSRSHGSRMAEIQGGEMIPKNQIPASMMFPKKVQRPLKSLIHTLDRIFSEYIRRRDADENGICRCITCNQPFHWKDGDAGHFIQRDRMATRWNEHNVHAQCKRCNRFRSGEQYQHGKAIDARHGAGTADRLKSISQVRGVKIDRFFLENQIEFYKKRLKS